MTARHGDLQRLKPRLRIHQMIADHVVDIGLPSARPIGAGELVMTPIERKARPSVRVQPTDGYLRLDGIIHLGRDVLRI